MYRQIITILLFSLFLSSSPAWGSISVPRENWEHLYESSEAALDQGHYKQAEISLMAALQATNGDTTRQFMTFDALVELYEEQKNYAAAEKVLLASLDLMRRLPGYPDALCGVAYQKLAEANLLLGRPKTAEQYAREAIPIIKNNCGPDSVDAAVALNNLGWVEFAESKLGLAETHFRQSLDIARRAIGEKTVFYGTVANNLASTYIRTGNRQAAHLWFQRSSAALNDSLGSDDSFAQDVTVQCRELGPAPQHLRKEAPKYQTPARPKSVRM